MTSLKIVFIDVFRTLTCLCACSTTSADGDPPDGLASIAEDKKTRMEVWRRYSEFEVLRSFLTIVYPHVSTA